MKDFLKFIADVLLHRWREFITRAYPLSKFATRSRAIVKINNFKLPMRYVSDEDAKLLETVKFRLKNPSKRVKVRLDEL